MSPNLRRPTNVICPVCAENGSTSTVTDEGTQAHLLGYQPYYDEHGVRHVHNPNLHATFYRCSNGHRFEHAFYQSCPSCGYTRGTETVAVLVPPVGVPGR